MLHYLAIASAAEVPWTIDDFERIRKRVPVLCNLKPSGDYVAVDLHRAGGVPQVLKMLLTHGVLHGDCMTITGRTIGEELETVPVGTARRSGRHPAVVEPDVRAGSSRDPARATWRPKAAWRRSPASRTRRSRDRRACSTPRTK